MRRGSNKTTKRIWVRTLLSREKERDSILRKSLSNLKMAFKRHIKYTFTWLSFGAKWKVGYSVSFFQCVNNCLIEWNVRKQETKYINASIKYNWLIFWISALKWMETDRKDYQTSIMWSFKRIMFEYSKSTLKIDFLRPICM